VVRARAGKLLLVTGAIGALAGCGGNPAPTESATPAAADDKPWVVVQTGSATPSPRPSNAGTPRPPLPPVSYLPTDSACTIGWPDSGQVLIPMNVTPVAGGFRVEWPSAYGPTYRLTAVHQPLVAGAQPTPSWQTVQAGAGCTVSATITGLISGDPYIIWLDAPDTPRGPDGSRSLYSGKTGVVKPR
jgi:hypothetical protein